MADFFCVERGCPFRYGCPEHPGPMLSESFFMARFLMVARFTSGRDSDCALDVPRRIRGARWRLRITEAARWKRKLRAGPDVLDYLLRELLADVFAGVTP